MPQKPTSPRQARGNCEAKVQVREKETRAPKVHKTAQSEKIDKRRKLLVLGAWLLIELGVVRSSLSLLQRIQ